MVKTVAKNDFLLVSHAALVDKTNNHLKKVDTC